MRHLIFMVGLLAVLVPASALAESKCGAQTCGTSTKSQKTIDGVVYNCDVKKCSTSCCSLADPPVCSIKTDTISDCTQARAVPGRNLRNLLNPPATKLQQ
jgi:hypothetical protein